jgi:hypothetical protein
MARNTYRVLGVEHLARHLWRLLWLCHVGRWVAQAVPQLQNRAPKYSTFQSSAVNMQAATSAAVRSIEARGPSKHTKAGR